jgi:hypothetical protein
MAKNRQLHRAPGFDTATTFTEAPYQASLDRDQTWAISFARRFLITLRYQTAAR